MNRSHFLPTPYFLLPTSYFLLLTLILTFAVTFSYISIQQHHTYHTNALDIGNVDQALWNTAHGCFLCFSLMTPVESRLALHVEPILYLFVPFYWLNLGSPELLLIAQATIVALGAWPLYQIARTQFSHLSPLTSHLLFLIFPLTYLLLPTLESAVLYDFHAVTFAPTFILYAYHALICRHDKRYWLFICLTLACKEDMPLLIAMLAIYIALSERRPRLAAYTLGLSAIWFITALFIIQPMFAAEGNIQLDRYDWLGSTPLDKIQTLLTQPRVIFDHVWVKANLPNYFFSLFFPTAFLALFSPMILLPMLPTLAINLLSDNPFTWRLEDFHYGAPLAPFIFIATIHTIKKLEMRGEKLEIRNFKFQISHFSPLTSHFLLLTPYFLLLTSSLFYHHQRGFTPLARPFNWPESTPRQAQLDRLIATIPPNITLFAQSNLAPHLTHRRFIYSDFAYFTAPAYPAPQPIEAILLDITTLENRGSLHEYLRDHLFQQSPYRLITAQDGLLYFQRTTTLNNNQLPPTAYSLLPTSYSLPTDFGQQIRLHGYTLHFNRQEEIQVTVDLKPLVPLSDLLPILYLLDSNGQPLGATTDLQPMLVWYPLAQWAVGEHVQVRFNTLPWYSRDMTSYRLALGMVQGADIWNIAQRLRPQTSQVLKTCEVSQNCISPRLAAEGSLLQLAYIQQPWHMPTGGPLLRQFTLPNPAYSLPANLEQPFSLLGYDAPMLNNDTLTITLYWQAHVINPPNLTRFVQLVGADGQLYGQQDSAPDNGQYPTNLWQQGEVVAETITLPLKSPRPAQNYTLHVGLYDPANGQRLPLTNGNDHVEITIE